MRLVAAIVCLALANVPAFAADSVVKVFMPNNDTGSGVYIGNGLVITAAHVVGDAPLAKLKSTDGTTAEAVVLWRSKLHDTALLDAPDLHVDVSELACRDAKVGEPVRAYGNPFDLEFVQIWGHVARDTDKRGVLVNMHLMPGMSGGPVFDESGQVLGISRARMTTSKDAPLPLSWLVPAKTICRLLGRV